MIYDALPFDFKPGVRLYGAVLLDHFEANEMW